MSEQNNRCAETAFACKARAELLAQPENIPVVIAVEIQPHLHGDLVLQEVVDIVQHAFKRSAVTVDIRLGAQIHLACAVQRDMRTFQTPKLPCLGDGYLVKQIAVGDNRGFICDAGFGKPPANQGNRAFVEQRLAAKPIQRYFFRRRNE